MMLDTSHLSTSWRHVTPGWIQDAEPTVHMFPGFHYDPSYGWKRTQGTSVLYLTPERNGVIMKFCDLKSNGNEDRDHRPFSVPMNFTLYQYLRNGMRNVDLMARILEGETS